MSYDSEEAIKLLVKAVHDAPGVHGAVMLWVTEKGTAATACGNNAALKKALSDATPDLQCRLDKALRASAEKMTQ